MKFVTGAALSGFIHESMAGVTGITYPIELIAAGNACSKPIQYCLTGLCCVDGYQMEDVTEEADGTWALKSDDINSTTTFQVCYDK